MIATHNIKVNGRWIHAGEEYEAEEQNTPKKKEKAEEKQATSVAEEKQEEQQAETKPKTAPRRKKASE